jgi:hypothetical protein
MYGVPAHVRNLLAGAQPPNGPWDDAEALLAAILFGSLPPWLPIIAPAPVPPPLGFLLLLAWRLLRPGLLPPWAGLPLGLFDDLYSGQPTGSGPLDVAQ